MGKNHENKVILGALAGAIIGIKFGNFGIVIGGFLGAIIVDILDKDK